MNNYNKVRVAIVGTGTMAQSHVGAYLADPHVELVAAVDTRPEILHAFCARHGIGHAFATIDELLAWGEFDAVSNVTPDAAHHATTLPFVAAGKHVLCEKPLASTYEDARDMADAAQMAGIVNMVNLSYRNGPALQKAAEMVANGAIGNLRHFEASYLQSWLAQPAWGDWKTEDQWLWRLSKKHGSKGVLGDVGIHIIDFAAYAMGTLPTSFDCKLHTFHKAPGDQIGEYPLDANDSFVMHMQCENGALGTISATRFAPGHHNDLRLRLYGDKGGLEVTFEKRESLLNACLEDDMLSQTWRAIDTPPVDTIYQKFITAIRTGTQSDPDFERGAQLQQILSAAEK